MFNVEYRRLGRLSGGGFPRTLDDVAAAVDHLADVPAHLPAVFDRSRVVAIGHSAGGHLATWLATRADARVPVTAVNALTNSAASMAVSHAVTMTTPVPRGVFTTA